MLYLDYVSRAPVRPYALEVLSSALTNPLFDANPSSFHSLGREADKVLQDARKAIAKTLNNSFKPHEIIFTSGGTESNNLAVLGMSEGIRQKFSQRTKVLISSIEHDSVLNLAKPLKSRGFEVGFIPCDKNGLIQPDELEAHVDAQTALVCVMYANNETGIIQPISELARIVKKAGAYFFTDAIAVYGKTSLNLLGVDALSIASHKIGSLPGVGVLALKRGTPFISESYGGNQEFGFRSGTQNTLLIHVFAKVAFNLFETHDMVQKSLLEKTQYVYERLLSCDKILPTSECKNSQRVPGIVSVVVKNKTWEELVLKLDALGYAVSSGSACQAQHKGVSHVLKAMNISGAHARGALRISFDERVSIDDLESFCETLLSLV